MAFAAVSIEWILLVTLALTVCAILHIWQQYYARKSRDLDLAWEALDDHVNATLDVLEHTAAPDSHSEMITKLSEVACNRKLATRVAEEILRKREKSFAENAKIKCMRARLIEESVKLEEEHPEILENCHMAIVSGLASMCLRWPEVSPAFVLISKQPQMSTSPDAEKFLPFAVFTGSKRAKFAA